MGRVATASLFVEGDSGDRIEDEYLSVDACEFVTEREVKGGDMSTSSKMKDCKRRMAMSHVVR